MLKRTLFVALLLGIGFVGSLSVRANAERPQPELSTGISVIAKSERSITLEYVAGEMTVSRIAQGSDSFDQIEVAGTEQRREPGTVQIPVASATIGLPDDAELFLKILDIETENVPGHFQLPTIIEPIVTQPLPDNLFSLDEIDLSVEASLRQTDINEVPLSHQPIELGTPSKLRDQSVVQVRFYPIEYQPLPEQPSNGPGRGTITLYRRIQVEIAWSEPEVQAANAPTLTSPYFEPILEETLLNYDQFVRPATGSLDAMRQPGGSVNGASLNRVSEIVTHTLKIWTEQAGFHQITYVDLVNVGYDLSADPKKLRLTNKGEAVAIWVIGEEDGTFDINDTILFYAESHDTDYSGENVYWLTLGDDDGLRMETVDGSQNASPTGPTQFRQNHHAEVNSAYWQTMPNGEEQDHWFWGKRLSAPFTTTRPFTLPHSLVGVDVTGLNAELRLQLKGGTDTGADPDHHTRLLLNGTLIDDQLWDGFSVFTHTVSISQTLLNDGPNTLTIIAPGDTGSTVDQLFVNWIEVDYWQHYRAEDDQVSFGVPDGGPYEMTVSGFTSTDLHLFETSNLKQIKRISNVSIDAANPEIALHFTHGYSVAGRYFALAESQYLTPTRMSLDIASTLRSPTNAADYILITHSDFVTETEPLTNFREGQGLRVLTATIDDIFDEFSHGIFDPQAIRDFLTYSYENWQQPAPAYVIFVGDATLDYRDRRGSGSVNYVPSQLIETQILGQTPSDNWFVQISGDDVLPDMFTGRLSAQTSQQVADTVEKIIRYETNPPDLSWSTRVLFVADDDASSFTGTSDALAALLPITYTVDQIDIVTYSEGDDPPADINAGMNEGALLTNYTGHGAVSRWGKWGSNQTIYQNDDVNALTNTNKLTIVTTANCLNGFFTGFQTGEALAEKFQRLPNGGAVAVWAPSNLFYPSAHRALLREFYGELFQKRTVTLGAATTKAKITTHAQSSGWDELVEAFILFGDPATSLDQILPQIPPTPTLVPTSTPTHTPTQSPPSTPTSMATEPMSTSTPTLTPTDSSATVEPLQTTTAEPSVTFTATSTQVPSTTGEPTATSSLPSTTQPIDTTLTPMHTPTPTPTATAIVMPTATPIIMPTATPSLGNDPTGTEPFTIFLPLTAGGK
ncbi:MAG: C25 family cysteine peptidase [Chloroflexota bacterium]